MLHTRFNNRGSKMKSQCNACKKEAKYLVGKDRTPLCKIHAAMRNNVDNSKQSKLGAILTEALKKMV